MSGKQFKTITLGCRTNQYESQGFADQLEQLGWSRAPEGIAPNLCIVNSCTVTANADRESLLHVRQLIRQYPDAKIVVTGCAAESHQRLQEEIPQIALVVGNMEKEQLIAKLFPEEEVPEFSIRRFEAHTRAFVKVQDGCNSFCTYCIIPYVRGRSRSRAVLPIIEEVKGLVANGYREVVLTGINIGDYDGGDSANPVRLDELVREVDQVPGLERLRLSSIDPDEVDEPLIDALLEGRTTAPSLHLVLQSGSNAILKRMNRKYTKEIFWASVERLLQRCPDFTFTTDVIVGFPGETESDFGETLEMIEEVQFAKVHRFPYSERPRTRAAFYPNKVPSAIIKERQIRLAQVEERASFQLRERYVGRILPVLTEEREGEGKLFGHTHNFLPTWIEGSQLSANENVLVKIEKNTPKGLVGYLCDR